SEQELEEVLAYQEERRVDKKIEQHQPGSEKLTRLKVGLAEVTYIFDGENKAPLEGYPGIFYKQRLYVPLRFVSEAIGKTIDWDPETYTVISKSENIVAEEDQAGGSGGAAPK